jgi:stearoyl-CoA desaturase (Delta-9 desaturase)
MLFYFLPDSIIIPVIIAVLSVHLTSICTSLYLHRSVTHKGVVFKYPVSLLMRIWLWLGTGVNTKEWVACHRKHHAFTDKTGDPHSPKVEGFWHVMIGGIFLYQKAVKDKLMVEKYGTGSPEDWIERNIFRKFKGEGLFVLLAAYVVLLGFIWGPLVWLIQISWTPLSGQIINGIGHFIGYRNSNTKDASKNIIPFGIGILGEELHNNHHTNPASPKFSKKWWEFDLGWAYIKLLEIIRLANINYAFKHV